MTATTTAIDDPVISPTYRDELSPHGLRAVPRRPAPTVDPRLATYRMPAEWAPHERTLLTWPTRETLWQNVFDEAKRDYAAVARAVADFEPVTVIALPGSAAEVLDHCGTHNIDVFETAVDDSWIRDNGPLVVRDANGHRIGVDFDFNSWGRKFLPYDADASVAARVLDHLGIERIGIDMVLEGGALSVDGDGTLVTTEQCVLHSNRNPGLSRDDIIGTLGRALGVDTVLAMPFGHLDDRHTDGHVDGVATFTRPGRLIAQSCGNAYNVNHEAMARNLRYLRDNPDARGRTAEVVGLDLWSGFSVDGLDEYVSYANFYVANGVVVVPTSGNKADDDRALSVIGAEFPDRQTIGVAGQVIAFGGGGPHCITMQIPAGSPS